MGRVLLYIVLQEAMGQRRGNLELRFNFFIIRKNYLLIVKILPRYFPSSPAPKSPLTTITTNLNVTIYSQRDDFPVSKVVMNED